MPATKQELRSMIVSRLQNLSFIDEEFAAMDIASAVTGTPEWESAEVILLYSSLPDEVSCSPMIKDAVGKGKTVVLPVVCGDDIRLFEYTLGQLQEGAYGIIEPTADCREYMPEDIDLAIVPARGYTLEGNRLGRGKGFYDRALPKMNCPKWGICYPCQILDSIPSDPWDIKVDRVFSGK